MAWHANYGLRHHLCGGPQEAPDPACQRDEPLLLEHCWCSCSWAGPPDIKVITSTTQMSSSQPTIIAGRVTAAGWKAGHCCGSGPELQLHKPLAACLLLE